MSDEDEDEDEDEEADAFAAAAMADARLPSGGVAASSPQIDRAAAAELAV
jgi:hypothetical protein